VKDRVKAVTELESLFDEFSNRLIRWMKDNEDHLFIHGIAASAVYAISGWQQGMVRLKKRWQDEQLNG